jgi:hypothetical protein
MSPFFLLIENSQRSKFVDIKLIVDITGLLSFPGIAAIISQDVASPDDMLLQLTRYFAVTKSPINVSITLDVPGVRYVHPF